MNHTFIAWSRHTLFSIRFNFPEFQPEFPHVFSKQNVKQENEETLWKI